MYNYLDYMHILQQLCGDGPVPRDDGRTMAVADALMTVNVLVSEPCAAMYAANRPVPSASSAHKPWRNRDDYFP